MQLVVTAIAVLKMIAITFREQTISRISDLLDDEGLTCARSQQLLAFLAGALISYVDEGKEFFPEILFCSGVGEVLNSFPGAKHYPIGEASLLAETGRRVLKDCGPLSSEKWSIYIERVNTESIRYGIFSYVKRPTSISLRDGIAINPAIFSVIMQRVSRDTVGFRGSKQTELNLIFSTLRAPTTDVVPIQKFVKDCCAGLLRSPRNEINAEHQDRSVDTLTRSASDSLDLSVLEDFCPYFERLIANSLSKCHGTILVSGSKTVPSDIPSFKDAIVLDPPINFFDAFRNYRVSESADSVLALLQVEDILDGLLRCDGIVSFDTEGCITAYRIFFRASVDIKIPGDVVGGARRRAFEGIKSVPAGLLVSVLFRSQDGQTIYHGVSDEH